LRVAQHPGIEVTARPACGAFVVARIHVVWSALERLNRQPRLPQRGNQSGSDRGLADVGGRTGNHDTGNVKSVFHTISIEGAKACHVMRPAGPLQVPSTDVHLPSSQNSIPACARIFLCFSGCLINVISVTRSARSMSSSGALRPVRTTCVLGGRSSIPSSTCSTET
jgi:hypothetical protein